MSLTGTSSVSAVKSPVGSDELPRLLTVNSRVWAASTTALLHHCKQLPGCPGTLSPGSGSALVHPEPTGHPPAMHVQISPHPGPTTSGLELPPLPGWLLDLVKSESHASSYFRVANPVLPGWGPGYSFCYIRVGNPVVHLHASRFPNIQVGGNPAETALEAPDRGLIPSERHLVHTANR